MMRCHDKSLQFPDEEYPYGQTHKRQPSQSRLQDEAFSLRLDEEAEDHRMEPLYEEGERQSDAKAENKLMESPHDETSEGLEGMASTREKTEGKDETRRTESD